MLLVCWRRAGRENVQRLRKRYLESWSHFIAICEEVRFLRCFEREMTTTKQNQNVMCWSTWTLCNSHYNADHHCKSCNIAWSLHSPGSLVCFWDLRCGLQQESLWLIWRAWFLSRHSTMKDLSMHPFECSATSFSLRVHDFNTPATYGCKSSKVQLLSNLVVNQPTNVRVLEAEDSSCNMMMDDGAFSHLSDAWNEDLPPFYENYLAL